MGRVGFTTENKGKVVDFNFPKLKLKNGEKARIIVGLEDPVMEYVHTLRKPTIVDGAPVIKPVTNEKTGVVTQEYQKDFVGNPICLGDEAIIADKGLDPAHCPACALAKEHPDMAEPPKRRFAMHVVRYRTKANSFNVQTPFSVELLVWSFTDMVFNKIVDAKEEWGDIRKHDFLLGPCTNETFQKFDINVGAEATWLTNDEWRTIVAQTFKENQIPDLTVAVGRQVQPEWMKQDVQQILEAWRIAKKTSDSGAGSTSSLGDDLNGLLGKDSAPDDGIEKDADGWAKSADPETEAALADIGSLKAEAQEAVNKPAADGDDMFGDLLASSVGADDSGDDAAGEPEPASEESEPEAPKTEAKKDAAPAGGVDNFDDLLAGV